MSTREVKDALAGRTPPAVAPMDTVTLEPTEPLAPAVAPVIEPTREAPASADAAPKK